MTGAARKYVFICCISFAVLVWLWNRSESGGLVTQRPTFASNTKGMEPFIGEWVLDVNDNFDAMLKELGVNVIKRAFAGGLTTYMDIRKVGDNEYEVKTVTGPVKKIRNIKFGVEFEDDAPTGGQMSGSWTFKDEKMVGSFCFTKDNRKMLIVRYLENGKLIELMTVGEQTSRRTFKRKK